MSDSNANNEKSKDNTSTPSNQAFIKLFDSLARKHHRYTVFKDFVTMTAISLHNAVNKIEALEQEYLHIKAGYSEDEREIFPKLFAELVELLEEEPKDVLGGLYMELNLGNDLSGQYFTPPNISKLLAKLNFSDDVLETQPFIKVSDPTCGAGGMLLAYAHEMIQRGHVPAYKMWVQAIDIDRTAALMCYIQLTLWDIPAQVIVGDTLTLEFREEYYTMAHHRGMWDMRLILREVSEAATPSESNPEPAAQAPKPKLESAIPASETEAVQFDLLFGDDDKG